MRKLRERPSPRVSSVSFNRRPSKYCEICSKQSLPFCRGNPTVVSLDCTRSIKSVVTMAMIAVRGFEPVGPIRRNFTDCLPKSEDQQIARFVNGLRVAIRDQGKTANTFPAVPAGDKQWESDEGSNDGACPKRATVNLVEPVPKEEDGGDNEGEADPYSYDPNEFQDDEKG
ncbi:hypothetical protein Acr_13g0005640 [Actinidia rufa]|uniref:Uncharacterized protein n=1 Tax=Actinidia rufa TaxID=165716 RepID=A0A7J0FKR7_9ERIC|nr:hypothetical protein Acr_13g0005640 [Actinidia rufa]